MRGLFQMPSMTFLTNPPPGPLVSQTFTFLSALMAPLSQKASWRRADPVVARSDDFGTAMSSGANIQAFA